MLVPKKGLEPPHPCEYMDLNHARLPIPPLRRCALALSRALHMTVSVFQTAPRLSIERRIAYTCQGSRDANFLVGEGIVPLWQNRPRQRKTQPQRFPKSLRSRFASSPTSSPTRWK